MGVDYYPGNVTKAYNRITHKIHFKTYERTSILDVYNVMYEWQVELLMEGLDDKLLQHGISEYLTRGDYEGKLPGSLTPPTIGIIYDYDNTNMVVTKDLILRGSYHPGRIDYSDYTEDTVISYRAYYIPYPSSEILSGGIDFEKVISSVVYGPIKTFKVYKQHD